MESVTFVIERQHGITNCVKQSPAWKLVVPLLVR